MTQKDNQTTSQQQPGGVISVISEITRSRLLSALLILIVLVFMIAFYQGRSISLWPPGIGELPSGTSQPATPAAVLPTTAINPGSVNIAELSPEKTLIERIDFDYPDSPANHGWVFLENEADETQLAINHIADQFVGRAIAISSPVKYGMEFKVGLESVKRGSFVEFVANFEKSGAIYAFVTLERDDGSMTTGWLKLTSGTGQPRPIDGDEWRLLVEPASTKGGDWSLYQVDLPDAVRQTFGTDGWKFRQLEKFRMRGNLSLDYIAIFGIQPHD